MISLGVGLYGCGSPPEPAKGPAPVKVEWSNAGSGEDTAGDSAVQPGEVDLDAPPAKQPAIKKEPPKEPAPPKEPEPAAESTPPPAEAEAESESESESESDVEAPADAPTTEPAAPTPLGKEIRAAVKNKEKPSAAKKPPPKKKRAAAQPAAAYTGPNPCKTTQFSVPRVKAACDTGGRTAAKGVMKDAVGKALAAGASLKCGDCHADTTSYALKKDAVAQLKKWLGP